MTSQDVRRFMSKFRIKDGCWNWEAGKFQNGYGAFHISSEGKRQITKAHRIAWRLRFGSIPASLCVCHHCDNPPCVNPQQLFLGTYLDNNRDRQLKGRSSHAPRSQEFCKRYRGELNPSAKLNQIKVLSIRKLYSAGNSSQQNLAIRFGVTKTLIRYIVKRRIWRHI